MSIGFWQFKSIGHKLNADNLNDQFQVWNGDGMGNTLVKTKDGWFGSRSFSYSVEMKYSDRELRQMFADAIRGELSAKCGKIDEVLAGDLNELLGIEDFSFSADKPLNRRDISQIVDKVEQYVENLREKPNQGGKVEDGVKGGVGSPQNGKTQTEDANEYVKIEPNPEEDELFDNIVASVRKKLEGEDLSALARGFGDELFKEIFKDEGELAMGSDCFSLRHEFDEMLKNAIDAKKDSWRKLVKSAFNETAVTGMDDKNEIRSIEDFKSRLRSKLLDSLKGECRNGKLVYECQLNAGIVKLKESYEKGGNDKGFDLDRFYNGWSNGKMKEKISDIRNRLGEEKFKQIEQQLKSDIGGVFGGSTSDRVRQIRYLMIDEMAEAARRRQDELNGKLSEENVDRDQVIHDAHTHDLEAFAEAANKALEKHLEKQLERYDFGDNGGNVQPRLGGLKEQIDGSPFEIVRNAAVANPLKALLQKGGLNCFIVSVVNGMLNTKQGVERLNSCFRKDGGCEFPALMPDGSIRKIVVTREQLEKPGFAAPFDQVLKQNCGMSKLEIAIWEGLIAMAGEQGLAIKAPGNMEDAALVAHLFGLEDYEDALAETQLDAWANTARQVGDEVMLLHSGSNGNYQSGHYFTIVGAENDIGNSSQKYVATNSLNGNGGLTRFESTDVTMQKGALQNGSNVMTLRRFRFVEIPDEPAKI